MGATLRFKVCCSLALVAISTTALVIACGGDDGGGGGTCEGTSCDGGANESSTDSSQPQPDGSMVPTDGGNRDARADADGGVIENCGDGGPPGTLDETFGDGGMVWLKYPSSAANAVTVQADGKIVVAGSTFGSSRAVFVRLLSNGSLDPSFGNGGFVESYIGSSSTQFNAVAVQPDGRIVGVGSTQTTGLPLSVLVARHLGDGGLDTTFGDGGIVLTSFPSRAAYGESVLLQPDGKILVSGYSEGATTSTGDYVLARFNADGSLDNTFGTGGKVSVDVAGTSDAPGVAALLPSAKIIVGGGSAQSASASARFDVSALRRNSDGTADPSFADAGVMVVPGIGKPFNSPVASVVAAGAGGVLFAGGFRQGTTGDDFGVCRVNASGALDPTFGDAGVVTTDFGARGDFAATALLEPSGKITLIGTSLGGGAGTQAIALARYLANGSLDPTFGTSGLVLTLPPPNADLSGTGATLHGCGLVAVGVWLYNENTLEDTAIGIARYRR